MPEVFFAHPHTLLNKVGQTLKEVGPCDFFKNPDEKIKKAREALVAYFFTLTLKEFTGRDWWLAQPSEAERQCPDFDFISFSEEHPKMHMEPVELTEVCPYSKSFEDVMAVIGKKQKHYGNNLLNFSLLVFVNHARSEEWIKNLRGNLKTQYPFLSIWTIHLLFKKGGKEVEKVVAHKVRPIPVLRIEADTSDPKIHQRQPLPKCFDEVDRNGVKCVIPKPDFMNEFRKKHFFQRKRQ